MTSVEDDSRWKKFLRGWRLLPPTPDETETAKQIRQMTTLSFSIDLICSILFLSGSRQNVPYCCGEKVFGQFYSILNILIVVYLVVILIQIRRTVMEFTNFPYHIVINPYVGYVTVFGVFMRLQLKRSMLMWFLVTIAIMIRAFVYKLIASQHTTTTTKEDSDDNNNNCNGNSTQDAEVELYYRQWFKVGTIINIVSAAVTLALFITLRQTGGLCFQYQSSNIFDMNPEATCYKCNDVDGFCQICELDLKASQCFYPY